MPNHYVPDKLKIIKGSLREHRLNKDQPIIDGKAPKAPDYLDDYAKEEWVKIVDILERRGTIDRGDEWGLAQLCLQLGKVRRFAERKKALLESGEADDGQVDYCDSRINTASEYIRKWLPAYGLTQESIHKTKSLLGDKKENPFNKLKNVK